MFTPQSNVFNKDTKGTETSVRFTEVSVYRGVRKDRLDCSVQLLLTDTSLLRTVHLVLELPKIIHSLPL